MKISYVTTYDAKDIQSWSGLGYHIAKSLENQSFDVDYIGSLSADRSLFLRAKSLMYKISGKQFLHQRDPSIAIQYARAAKALLKQDTDLIFSTGTIPIAMLESNKPKVFYTDATFAGMINFYSAFSNLCNETIRNGNNLEKLALDTSALAIYSSDWAAKTAIDNYNISPDKVKVVPFGASIECDRDVADIKRLTSIRGEKKCKLLFLGRDWYRKGGDIALSVVEQLVENGVPAELHIVGVNDLPFNEMPSYVINHGFVSKSTEEGLNKFNKLLENCHFLILPSRADCTPVVYSEANSFGLPCISTNVGGISTIIKDDINGKTFPLSADSNEYSDYISTIFNDSVRYRDLSLSSFNEYETRLNWEVSGRLLSELLLSLK